MAVTLNRRAYEHARELIDEGRFVLDERDAWSEHQPSAQEENEYIRLHGFAEYGKWYLGVNDEKPQDTKGHHEFPYGDFKKAHRCGLLVAESRAGQYKHLDIENAAHHLHGMLESRKGSSVGPEALASDIACLTWDPAAAMMLVQRFATQSTRLSSRLTSKHVISGK